MQQAGFKKLEVDLPRQPFVNQKPWAVAGVIFAFLILLFIAYAYASFG